MIDDPAVEVTVKLYSSASEGGADHALYRTIEEVMAELEPGSRLLPYLLVGTSDARHLMRRGVKVCGFAPLREEPEAPVVELVHGDDERISVDNVGFGARALYHIVERFCADIPASAGLATLESGEISSLVIADASDNLLGAVFGEIDETAATTLLAGTLGNR